MADNRSRPIVLAHGIARFDILLEILKQKTNLPETKLTDQFQYFKGIKSHLEADGFKVFHPNQDFAGTVEVRAEQLKARVEQALSETGADKAHIIGHSMGGLDARHMIVDKGMAEKVASLTTIGTPHLGTVLADYMIDHGGFFLMDSMRRLINLDGFVDLKTSACESFNKRAEDSEARNGVVYHDLRQRRVTSFGFRTARSLMDFHQRPRRQERWTRALQVAAMATRTHRGRRHTEADYSE